MLVTHLSAAVAVIAVCIFTFVQCTEKTACQRLDERYSHTGFVLHCFPNPDKFPELFKVWVEIAGRLETPSDFEFSKKKMCDIHFKVKHKNRNKRLNALAVPCLYLRDASNISSVLIKHNYIMLSRCERKKEQNVIRSNVSVYIYGRERQVKVLWDGSETSRAAAALLAAVLRHGLRYRRLSLAQTEPTICDLANHTMQDNCQDYDQSDTILNELYLIPAIGWKEGRCEAMELCFKIEVVPLRLQLAGESAAPLRLQIHVLLSKNARNRQRCKYASLRHFDKDREALVECEFALKDMYVFNFLASLESFLCYTFDIDFLTNAFPSTAMCKKINRTHSNHCILYIYRINSTAIILYHNSTRTPGWFNNSFMQNYKFELLPSYEDLHRRVLNVVQSQNVSILFLDYDIWGNVPGVQLVEPPPCANSVCKNDLDTIRSVRVADVPILQQFAPHLLKVFEQFSPSPNDIREIIELETRQPKADIEEAACKWALNNTVVFKSWYRKNFKQQYWIAIFLCHNDPDKDNYKIAAREFVKHYKKATQFDVSVFFLDVDCSNESDLTNKFITATMSHRWSYLIGAIGAGAGTTMAAEYATKMETSLAVYDLPSADIRLGPAVHIAGGTLNQLVIATRHFILLHNWKRLAILSEETQLAKDFEETLSHTNGLVIRNIPLNTIENIGETLQSLKDSNARIFLLNSISNVSKEILCSAQELEMTSSNGYVWILREWRPSNLKCANSLNLEQASHFTISYWWQGLNDRHLVILRSSMTAQDYFLKTWNDSMFLPPLTVPMADAIQILIKKFDLFTRSFPAQLYDIHGNGSQRLVLKGMEEQYVDGLLQKLKYTNGALSNPFVYITQWHGNQPLYFSRWSVYNEEVKIDGENVNFYKGSTPSDGSHNCLTTSVGDPFKPECRDILCISVISFLLLLVFLLCLSWRIRIRKLEYHDSILRAQLLAKTEVVSTALVNHLIDRGGLEIYHDLGRGSFGRVRYAIFRAPGRPPVIVAVKEIRNDDTFAEDSDLLQEAVTLGSLHHPHVVKLIGVCTDGPLLVLIEYAFFGNLRDYLSERRHFVENSSDCTDASDEAFHISAISLTRLAREAVSALEYLSIHRIVHRDIRATNCLVDEQRSLKLADFGLARTTETVSSGGDEKLYLSRRRGLFPVRWMAPESLNTGLFTPASDVWGLGVLLLEIVTLGARPYGSWPLNRVMSYVCAGGHPPMPSSILPEMQELLLQCWQQAPETRLTATEIAQLLERNPSLLCPIIGPTEPIMDEEYPVPNDNNPIVR